MVGTYITIYPRVYIYTVETEIEMEKHTLPSVNTIFSIRSAVLRSLGRIKYNFRNDFSLGFLRMHMWVPIKI